jgi:hypothetical protein
MGSLECLNTHFINTDVSIKNSNASQGPMHGQAICWVPKVLNGPRTEKSNLATLTSLQREHFYPCSLPFCCRVV